MLDFNEDFYKAKKLKIKEDFKVFTTELNYSIRNEASNVVGRTKEKQSDFLILRLLNLLHRISKYRSFRKLCILYYNLQDHIVFKVDNHQSSQYCWEVTDVWDVFLGTIMIKISFGFKIKLKVDVQAQDETTIMSIDGHLRGKEFVVKNKNNQKIAQINKKSINVLHDLFTKKCDFIIDFEQECSPTERKLVVAISMCIGLIL